MMITVWSVFPSAALLIVCSTLDAIFVSLLPYDLQRSFDGDFFCSTYHLAIRCDHWRLTADLDSRLAYPRPKPRPRLWCPRPRPRLKTYKTNTGSPWLGWTVTNKKTEKVMASRKSSKHNIIPCFTSYNSAVTVYHCSVSNFDAYTQHFKSTMFDRQLKR